MRLYFTEGGFQFAEAGATHVRFAIYRRNGFLMTLRIGATLYQLRGPGYPVLFGERRRRPMWRVGGWRFSRRPIR